MACYILKRQQEAVVIQHSKFPEGSRIAELRVEKKQTLPFTTKFVCGMGCNLVGSAHKWTLFCFAKPVSRRSAQ